MSDENVNLKAALVWVVSPLTVGGVAFNVAGWHLIDDSDVWAALIGSVVGGMAAFFVGWIFRRWEERDRTNGHLISLFFKLVEIASHARSLDRHLSEMVTVDGQVQNLQNQPIAGLPREVHFSPDELARAASLRDPDLMKLLLALDEKHNGLVDAARFYNELQRELLSVITELQLQGIASDDQRSHRVRQPRLLAVCQAWKDLKESVSADAPDAHKAVTSLHKHLRARKAISFDITLKEPAPVARAAAGEIDVAGAS